MKLCIPEATIRQHVVMLGKTGAGKSSALRHIAEHLLTQKKRVCIIDPKGDWWGLKSSADGKGAGFPVIAFGDFKEPEAQDVPINDRSGKHVAELVASGNRPCVIGFRGWMPTAMTRFFIDFASTLFNANAGELHLFIDEVHNFAPKGKVNDVEAGKSLHWTNRLLSEGRGIGIVCLIASQRPQKVHNDTLTSCETLAALRVIHKSDRMAVKDWIDGCGDGSPGTDVLNTLASLPRGTAWVWSPECGFGPQQVKFPLFTTFDSFAPPQLQKKVNAAGWGEVDLTAVREKLAAVIEEAKANDPKELKAEIGRLRIALAKVPATAAPAAAKTVTVEKIVERPVIDKATAETLAHNFNVIGARVAEIKSDFEKLMASVNAARSSAPVLTRGSHAPRLATVYPSASEVAREASRDGKRVAGFNKFAAAHNARLESDGKLGKGERALLIACAQYVDGASNSRLTVLTGYKATSRRVYLQRLKQFGWIAENGDKFVATESGLLELGDDFTPLPTGGALREHWLNTLPDGERNILSVLIGEYPAEVPHAAIEGATNYKSTSRRVYLQKLHARGTVELSRDGARASPLLFDA